MSEKWKKISVYEITDNPFKLIGSDWMLITAGSIENWNTMTASWGGLGVLWNKEVSFCFIRPSRYTRSFMDKADYYTLSFFNEKYRDILNFCGSHSGRSVDKSKETGLSPVEMDSYTVSFREARLVLICKKIYFCDLKPENFLDISIEKNYPHKDYHRLFIGEIIKCVASD